MKYNTKVKEYLTESNIEFTIKQRESIDSDGKPIIHETEYANFPRARNFVKLRYTDKITESQYLESEINKFRFIEDYEAIWSPSLGIIECELQSLRRFGLPFRYKFKGLAKVFGEELSEETKYHRFEFEPSSNGIKISIGTPSEDFSILWFMKNRAPELDYVKRRATIRIENLTIAKHGEALKFLRKIGNAALFKVDSISSLDLKLATDRETRRFKSVGKIDEEIPVNKTFPKFEYDNETMSLYWYAKSARDMPLLQFLAYYQILEFYYPVFSQRDAHQKVKNIIKDPRFNANKDSDISKILSSIRSNKHQAGFGSELEQLKATVIATITVEQLMEIITSDEELLKYYDEKESKKLAKKQIKVTNPDSILNDVAERIYEIRCRIVHTKVSQNNYKLLLPSSPELKFMYFEIYVLQEIVKKVLISSSRQLNI